MASSPTNLSPEAFAAAMEVAATCNADPERIRSLLTPSKSKRPRQIVPFRDAGQVLEAVAGKLITREEARKLLGYPARKPRATKK